MSPLKLALYNLTRRRIPSLIAILSIAISIACSGILLRLNMVSVNRFSLLGSGGDALIAAKAGGIEILLGALNGEGEYPGFLPIKLYESIKMQQSIRFEDGTQNKPSFLRAIIPFVYFAKFHQFRVAGTDESFLNRPHPEDSLYLQTGQWATGDNEVVLGSLVAEKENIHVGDSIPLQPWTGERSNAIVTSILFKVVGILRSTESSWDRMLFSNLPSARKTLAQLDLSKQSIWGPDVLNYFLVYLQPQGFEALAALVNRRTVGQAILISEEKSKLEQLTGAGKDIGLFVTILILTLGGLSVTSMLVTRFEAMTLQLAVLRAIGYKKREIGAWLLWEGFLLGISACFIGMILDLIGFPMMRSLLSTALPSADIIPSTIFQSLPIWITAILATMGSIFIPLYRIYHQDVHFTLRG